MITAILKAIKEFFTMVFAAIARVLKWIRENPKKFGVIVLVAVSIATTFYLTRWYTTTKVWKEANVVIEVLRKEVEKANAETKKRDEKIEKIEKLSKEESDLFEADLKASKERVKKLIADYEKKLQQERDNNTIIVVTDPNSKKPIEVEINKDGEVVCSRFHNTFVDTVNKLVDEANRSGVKK